MLPRLMLVRGRDATTRQTQPDGWVARVSGGQYLRDDWIRVELAGVEHAVERAAGSSARAIVRLPIFAPSSSHFFQLLLAQDYFWCSRTVTRHLARH